MAKKKVDFGIASYTESSYASDYMAEMRHKIIAS